MREVKNPQEDRSMIMRRLHIVAACLAALLLSAYPAAAQAFGLPKSDRVIQGEVVVGDETVHFEAREGTLVTLQTIPGVMTGLSPAVLDERGERVGFLVLRITDVGAGRQDAEQLGDPVEVETGARGTVTAMGTEYEIAVAGIATGRFPGRPAASLASGWPHELARRYGRSGGGTCAVACGPVAASATAIRMSCGACDSGWSR
jgi:hypothetical protein